MTPTEYPVYDFLTASKVERPLSAALKVWLSKFSGMFVERWLEFAPTEIQVTAMLIEARSFDAAQSRWTAPAVGLPIDINHGAVQGLVVVSRSDLLILMMEILSETITEKPADRELTSIESSLCELFFQHSIATFSEAWPAKEPLPIDAKAIDWQPNRCRLFQPERELISTGFEIRTSCGADAGPARVEWLFAKDDLKKLLGVTDAAPIAKSNQKIDPENLFALQIELTALLGSAELEMDQLLQLSVGDIVKLNQRIEQPLPLLVNDHPTFFAWPGRHGVMQCMQLD